jgi:hypothetical protein
LYRDTGPPGHRLRIFLNSTYGQKTAGRVRRGQLAVAKRLYCSEFSGVPIK